MFYALGRVDEAAELYRQWLRVEPDHPIAVHMLAACTGIDVPARASDDFVRSSFDDFAMTFDRTLQRLEYRAPVLVGEATMDLARSTVEHLLSQVLDAGCGTGLVATMIRPYVKRLVGVDLSANGRARSRARTSRPARRGGAR
jgi:predicted TPR repeat methyltransferase